MRLERRDSTRSAAAAVKSKTVDALNKCIKNTRAKLLKYQRRMDEPTRLEILATPDFVKSANVRTVYINDEPDHSNPYGGGGVGAKKVVRRVMPNK